MNFAVHVVDPVDRNEMRFATGFWIGRTEVADGQVRIVQEAAESARAPLTINGVHLTTKGNEEVARIIEQALFLNKPAGSRDAKTLATLRKAILDKNFCWFERYRTPAP